MDTVKGLDTRLTTAEGDIQTNASDISALETRLNYIGTWTHTGSSVSAQIDTSTYTNMCTFTLPAGLWVIVANARFSGGSAGSTRMAAISTTSQYSNIIGSQQLVQGGTGYTILNPVRLATLTSETTFYLVVYSSIACTVDYAWMGAMRIGRA